MINRMKVLFKVSGRNHKSLYPLCGGESSQS